ncbi:phosphotransferase [Planococcus halocryophilus]|uniref:phosphotransferase n=1 Tax=Planococcus halocryophilus TaxID=1215089 RepID=UPI0022A9A53B
MGNWEGVLRRPPFGEVPPRAHDMEREYRMLEKVNPVFPLAPKPYIYCEDPELMDKHFYIMEKNKVW